MGISTDIIAALITIFFSVILSYITAQWKTRDEINTSHELDIRRKRMELYMDLWTPLQYWASSGRFEPVTYDSVKRASVEMRKWYYEKGGLFLSQASLDRYIALQEEIQAIVKLETTGQLHLSDEQITKLVVASSNLRKSMTEDIASRKDSQLRKPQGKK